MAFKHESHEFNGLDEVVSRFVKFVESVKSVFTKSVFATVLGKLI